MTVIELIQYLSKFPSNQEVMILDSFNGGGTPREINLKSTRTITEEMSEETCDCEEKIGQEVIVLGFGNY